MVEPVVQITGSDLKWLGRHRGDQDDDGRLIPPKEARMQNMGDGDCPFEFNFDPVTFKVGDCVSYRVTGSLAGMPFVGPLMEVHDDHVVLTSDPNDPASRMRATRESRPVVDEKDIC